LNAEKRFLEVYFNLSAIIEMSEDVQLQIGQRNDFDGDVNADGNGEIDPGSERTSIHQKFSEEMSKVSDDVISTVRYIRKYSTAVLSKQLNDSIWVNFENIPMSALKILVAAEFITWFSVVFYFAVTSYLSQSTQNYVSLSDGTGMSTCQEIPRVITVESVISVNSGTRGAWSSSPSYLANTTAYTITLESFRGSSETFASHLQETAEKLKELGEGRGHNRGLPWNLVVWSTFTHVISTEETGRYQFMLLGDVTSIFRKQVEYCLHVHVLVPHLPMIDIIPLFLVLSHS
jgi:hypothetical protein